MSSKYREPEKEQDENDFDAGFKIPDVKQALGGIDEAIKRDVRAQHEDQTEEEEKAAKAGKPKPVRKKKRGGQICFCGNPACGIGEFVELRGEETEE